VLALDRAALAVEIFELDLLVIAAQEYEIPYLLRQAFERRLDVEFRMARQRLNELEIIGVAPIPAAHGAAGERQVRIGDYLRRIEKILVPRPSQVGQAPMGLLKENSRGSSSLRE